MVEVATIAAPTTAIVSSVCRMFISLLFVLQRTPDRSPPRAHVEVASTEAAGTRGLEQRASSPSNDSDGNTSRDAVFTSGPRFVGADHGSWTDLRTDCHRSNAPMTPGRPEAKMISRPSRRTVGVKSACGLLSSATSVAGPAHPPGTEREVDIEAARTARPVAGHVELRNRRAPWPQVASRIAALEEARAGIGRRGVDSRSEIHRRLPAGIVVRIGTPREPDVEAPRPTRAIGGEEQQPPVERQRRRAFVGGRVDRGPEIRCRAPGVMTTGAPRHPEVFAAQRLGSVGREVERQPVAREMGGQVLERRVHVGAEVLGLGPLRDPRGLEAAERSGDGQEGQPECNRDKRAWVVFRASGVSCVLPVFRIRPSAVACRDRSAMSR